MAAKHTVIHGIGVSAGAATGKVALMQVAPGVDPDEKPSKDVDREIERVNEAMKTVADQLKEKADKVDGKPREVLEATAQLAKDKGLAKAITKKLRSGLGTTRSVADASADYAKMLESLGGYMAERVTDLYDVRDRIICELRGMPAPGVPDMNEPMILVTRDLAPADTSTLDLDKVLGIITAEGGPTSHTAILAAQLGIPTVVRARGILKEVQDGDVIAFDGSSGEVIIAPSEKEIEDLHDRSNRRNSLLKESHGLGQTKDGHRVELMVNIGTVADARNAAKFDSEGVGLFRTEFLFLERQDKPSIEEQTEIYTQVLKEFEGRRVVVRTMDIGADKPLAFANQDKEENPALGVRGLRLGMSPKGEGLLNDQLQALSNAYKATHADLWVMAPMVATRAEAQWFADKVAEYQLPTVGIMVEVPAAAICANNVLKPVKFASLGTNDLTQYTMAADRVNSNLTELLTPWHPAVLRMFDFASQGAHEVGAHIGVCGEAGGDPLLALVLTGLGIESLSMAPKKLDAVRAVLKLHDFDTCKEMAKEAMDSSSKEEARERVLKLVNEQVRDLL